MDDDPTGAPLDGRGRLYTGYSNPIGLKHKMKNKKKKKLIQNRKILNLVNYILAGQKSLLQVLEMYIFRRNVENNYYLTLSANKTIKTALAKCSMLMTVRWTV